MTPLRILLVDDDVEGAEAMRQYLALRGQAPTVVHSGEAALVALQEGAYDAMITDIRLPGIAGDQLAQQLRASGRGPRCLVALSGERMPDGVFDLCVSKPCRPRALVDAVLTLAAAPTAGSAR